MKVLVGLSYCRAHAADGIMKPFANDIAAEKMICNDATTSLRCLLLGMVMVMSDASSLGAGGGQMRIVPFECY